MPDQPGTDQAPASVDSLLAKLRLSRDAAKKKLHLDLKVPRLDPAFGVRFRPVHQREVDAAQELVDESKDPDRLVAANSTLLAAACLGVFPIVDDKPVGDPSAWPKFDARLAQLLGVPEDTPARSLVQCLYLADGDIIAAATRLSKWSGKVEQLLSEETAGN